MIIPCLVTGLGEFGCKAARNAFGIYIKGNPKRETVTTLIDSPKFIPETEDSRNSSADILRDALHRLHTLENMVEAGIEIDEIQPVNIFLTCDMLEEEAGALIDLMDVLKQAMRDYPYARLYLLLSCALFPDESDTIKEGEKTIQERLERVEAALYGAENVSVDFNYLPMVFLFDHLKMGSLVVKDRRELGCMIENALTALMMGRYGNNLSNSLRVNEMRADKTFFHSMGCCLLVNQPDVLIDACAHQFAAKFIQEEFLNAISKTGVVARNHNQINDQIDNNRIWTDKILAENPCKLVNFSENGPELGVHFKELVLRSLDVLDLKAINWRETFNDFEKKLEEGQAKEIKAQMRSNRLELCRNYKIILSASFQKLPEKVELYPGGAQTAIEILEAFLTSNKEIVDNIAKYKPRLSADEIHADIQADMDKLDAILESAPPLPRWTFALPKFLQRPLALIVRLTWLIKNWLKIAHLRTSAVAKFENKYASIFTVALDKELLSTGKSFSAPAKAHIKRYKRLLEKERASFDLLQSSASGSSDAEKYILFRPRLVNEGMIAWAYQRAAPVIESCRRELIGERKLLAGWENLPAEGLRDQVLLYAREKFRKLQDIPLSDILEEWARHQQRTGGDKKKALVELFSSCAQTATPLLRPNFDRIGGMAATVFLNTLVLPENCAHLQDIPIASSRQWEYTPSGDSTCAAFCQVLMNVPLSALEAPGKRKRK